MPGVAAVGTFHVRAGRCMVGHFRLTVKNYTFITQRYPNLVEKATFSPLGYYFCFYLIFFKKVGYCTKNVVKKLPSRPD